MGLIRLAGDGGGIRIYNSDEFSLAAALDDYEGESGYKPTIVSELSFDVMFGIKLSDWIMEHPE